jgi:hypothetical protein
MAATYQPQATETYMPLYRVARNGGTSEPLTPHGVSAFMRDYVGLTYQGQNRVTAYLFECKVNDVLDLGDPGLPLTVTRVS